MCATCNLGRFFRWHQKMVGTETWDFHQFSPLFPPPPVEKEMNLQSLGILRQFSQTTSVFFWGGGNLKSLLPKGKITQKEVVFFCLKMAFFGILRLRKLLVPLELVAASTNSSGHQLWSYPGFWGGSHEIVWLQFPQENNAQIYCKCQKSHKIPRHRCAICWIQYWL